MLHVEIGGRRLALDCAAISALRYRAAYGGSVVTHLQQCRTARELEAVLLRLCHRMIPPAERPELAEFARLARRDGAFLSKACAARDALLAPDPGRQAAENDGPAEPFDEYRMLALLAAAGLDLGLVYELPLLHLLSLLEESFRLRDPDRRTYRPMTEREMATLYPR